MRKRAVLIFVVACTAPRAFGLDPRTRITQYAHTAWRVQDGVFEAAPSAVAQTADGYIWIGTGSGLVKYDGARFDAWLPPPGKSLPDPNVISLRGSSDGTLWIGTAHGLVSWKNNDLRVHLKYRINAIIEDHKRRIWVARARNKPEPGGLCQVTGEHPGCFGADDQIKLPYAVALAEDIKGNLWVAGTIELLRWREGLYEPFFREQLAPFNRPNGVESVAPAADGSVWVSIPSEKRLGLLHIVDGRPKRVSLAGVKQEAFTKLFIDGTGSLWLATADRGIYRLQGESVDHFGAEDGLSSNTVHDFFEDREGNLWVTTSKGLDFFRENRVVTFSTSEGLPSDVAESVIASDDGTVWISNRATLNAIRNGKVISIPVPGQRVTALWQDHAKRLWVGVGNGVAIYDRGHFQPVNRPDGRPLGITTAIAEDREQNIWAVANPDRTLFRIRDGRVVEDFHAPQIPYPTLVTPDPSGGVWLGFLGSFGHYGNGELHIVAQLNALDLMAEEDGALWASTTNGLVHWQHGRIETLTSKNGLKCDTVYSAIRDDRKTLWLYTKCGLIGIADSELQSWLRQPGSAVRSTVFDALDGARPSSSTFSPASAKSPDGRLWFVNDEVLQMFDPSPSNRNSLAGPVYVQGVRAGRKDYPIDAVRLPSNPRDIEISYTALSYSIPQKIRFRYKLEPRDSDWQDAGTRRQAFYSDLPPGQFRFHVAATNGDGVWNESSAAVVFSVMPAYYQTNWFRVSLIAAGLLLLWGLYRLRMRQLAREFNAHLEGQGDERVRVARELHDTLLQTVQGLIPMFQTARNLLPERAERAMEILDDGLKDAADAIVEGRNAIQNLRANPSMERDLEFLLNETVQELRTAPEAAGSAPDCRVIVEGSREPMAPLIQDEVYRIGREVLRNAFRHAHASRIEVEVRYNANAFRLRIRDDGRGINSEILKGHAPSRHWGLAGMHERAKKMGAHLSIWSESGAGTEAELTVPARVAYAKSRRSSTGYSPAESKRET